MKHLNHAIILSAALVSPLAACTAQPDAASKTESTSDELRVLGSDEIIGALSYGQVSSPVSYRSTPRYRAFSFAGNAGDKIEALVSNPEGDAVAWLLDASFRTITSNNDANGSTRDSLIAARLASTGTYYIAFRDVDLEPGTFTVELRNAGASVDAGAMDAGPTAPVIAAPVNELGPPCDDPFTDEGLARIAVTHARVAGSTWGIHVHQGDIVLGRYQTALYTRTCDSAGLRCNAWRAQDLTENLVNPLPWVLPTYVLNRSGDMVLQGGSSSPLTLTFRSDVLPVEGFRAWAEGENANIQRSGATASVTGMRWNTGDDHPSTPDGFTSDAHMAETLSGTIGNGCVRLEGRTKRTVGITTDEYAVVISSRWNP